MGTRWTELRHGPQGLTQQWELEVIEFEPDRVLGTVGRFGAARIAERHVFLLHDGGTHYTLYLEMTGPEIPTVAVQRRTVDALLHLKWLLEAPGARDR